MKFENALLAQMKKTFAEDNEGQQVWWQCLLNKYLRMLLAVDHRRSKVLKKVLDEHRSLDRIAVSLLKLVVDGSAVGC